MQTRGRISVPLRQLKRTVSKIIKFLINQAVQDFFSNTFPTTVFKLKYILISYTISNNEM